MTLIKTKQDAKNFVNGIAQRVMNRIVTEADAQQPPPDVAPAAPPAAPPAQGANDVSISKVASGEEGQVDQEGNELQKGSITLDMVVDKLNSIRSGKSFKDDAIASQMGTYFDDLNDNEKLALYAFLKGISQIVTGEIQGQNAQEPEDAGQKVVDNGQGPQGRVKHVRPNIVKKTQPSQPAAPSTENTSAPISAKQR